MLRPGSDEWLALAAGAHTSQREFLLDRSTSKMVLAGRQSGKSWAVICAMIDAAFRRASAQCLYMTFSAAAAERTRWQLALEVLRAYELLDECKIVERKQTIEFDNRSIVSMLGADDVAHMETFRGGKSDMIVVDEVGAQPTRVLQPLIDEILEPQLRATNGTMIVIGTPPRKRAGWFSEQWHAANAWRKWHWTGAQNAHCPGFSEFVARVAERRGIPVTHASIRREYFAEWVDDISSSVLSAYGDACLYDPSPRVPLLDAGWTTGLAADEQCAIGVDPGSRDRLAIEVLAWTAEGRVRQVGEWVTARDAHTTMGALAQAIIELRLRFDDAPVYIDTSHRMAIDTLGRDWGIGAVESADKTGRQAQLDRVNDLCATGRLMVARNSALDADARLTEWEDSKADPSGPRHYSRANHPDALDAARYALSGAHLPHATPQRVTARPSLGRRERERARLPH